MGQILSICWKNGADWIQSLQTMRWGGALRDSATLLEVLCSGEVIGPDKRMMQSFALINVKVTPQIRLQGLVLLRYSLFKFVIKKKRDSLFPKWNWKAQVFFSLVWFPICHHSPALSPLSFCQSHSVTLLILYVTTLMLFWLDALNVHCVVALQVAPDSLPFRAVVSYGWAFDVL